MNSRRFLGGALFALAAVALTFPGAAAAHPLGNFTVNHYSRLEVGADQVKLRYVLDMAEIPTFQEMSSVDTDRNGTVSQQEQSAYIDKQAASLRRDLRLTLNGSPVDLTRSAADLTFPAGQGGLQTLRLVMDFTAPVPAGARPVRGSYLDNTYPDRIGWIETIVQPTNGAGLQETTAPDKDQTNELRNYPDDLLASPLSRRDATFAFQPGAASSAIPVLDPVRDTAGRATDAFAALISTEELGPGVIALSLLLALGLGAMHAMSPGHGKTIVGAYLVGTRGTAKHALFLGSTVTITHTIGVFILGFITLFLSQYILPERLYPWLELISGLLVIGIGISLFGSRLAGALKRRPGLPTHDEHSHDDADPGLVHSHGGVEHSHVPPGANGKPFSWRSLLALGISGGLLPCPSALVVMLSAISLHRVAFGLVLILAFSIGLAGVLTGIGLLLVYAGKFFNRIPTQGRLIRLVPVASAAVIVLAGIAITAAALPATKLM